MSINKATGQATIVGESGIGTATHGMAFDQNDTLYLYQGGTYTVDVGTGAATYLGNSDTTNYAHHGDFNPDDNLFYGMGEFQATGTIRVFDLAGDLSEGAPITLDRSDVFTLAFVEPVPVPGAIVLLASGVAGLGVIGYRRRAA